MDAQTSVLVLPAVLPRFNFLIVCVGVSCPSTCSLATIPSQTCCRYTNVSTINNVTITVDVIANNAAATSNVRSRFFPSYSNSSGCRFGMSPVSYFGNTPNDAIVALASTTSSSIISADFANGIFTIGGNSDSNKR
jgi:hypothetical protein